MNDSNLVVSGRGAFDIQLQEAVNGLLLRRRDQGRDISAEELQAFRNKVAANIATSHARNDARQELRDRIFHEREDHRDSILDKAEDLGVKFFHRRNMELVTLAEHVKDLNRSKSIYSVTTVMQEVNSSLGGETFAFIYKVSDKNKLSMIYATAFCRNDERFDEVIGMQVSLDKFIHGEVVEMPLAHDRLGPPKMLSMAREHRRLFRPDNA